MERLYRAVPYKADIHHDAEPESCIPAYTTTETRYRIVSTETGKMLDDAQGYGYKSAQKAYAAYAYKTRDKSKDKKKQNKQKYIRKWMRNHEDFVHMMDECATEIAKGSMGQDAKFDAKAVSQLLSSSGLEVSFTATELLNEWWKWK